ncbi:MAG TPA: glycosyltransferase family 2 protein [Candidatus Paceibacterota bacterium]|jgi:glycosyltransferase involved in cell wall biosynthesis|nr:glycosyltransferase family 2 protein [Candidatus Paceibacterota bacterium]
MSEPISIIIPAYNEAENLRVLVPEIQSTLKEHHLHNTEIIVVDDGSSDNTSEVLRGMCTLITFPQNRGKASALQAGFNLARGSIVITMDADLQDDPREIPRFIAKINEGYDLVSGRKFHRLDSFIKNNTSKIYNAFTSFMSGVHLHDHNCGFKSYRADVLKKFTLRNQLHRYIPVLAAANGHHKIAEINVNHRKRAFGETKYNWSRFIWGILGFVDVVIATNGRALFIVRKISPL